MLKKTDEAPPSNLHTWFSDIQVASALEDIDYKR